MNCVFLFPKKIKWNFKMKLDKFFNLYKKVTLWSSMLNENMWAIQEKNQDVSLFQRMRNFLCYGQESKMSAGGSRCQAWDCKNSTARNRHVHYHRFPKDPERLVLEGITKNCLVYSNNSFSVDIILYSEQSEFMGYASEK